MSGPEPGTLLVGRSVLMSASVPSPQRSVEFTRIPDAAMKIEQAVVSLTRAVLAEGGRLVFGGHPAISPLVASVAGEYRGERRSEDGDEAPQVEIYQSQLFRDHAPEATMLMFRTGAARVHWIAAAEGEHYDPSPATGPRYAASLARMRRAMIEGSDPACMVCIGGMEGVIAEAALFLQLCPGRPCYVLGTTGGASARLGRDYVLEGRDLFDFVDARVLRDAIHRAAAPRGSGEPDRDSREERDIRREHAMGEIIPYPLIVQTIVAELADKKGE